MHRGSITLACAMRPAMEFAGDLTNIYKQIGNAVPVKLAESVGHDIYKILEEKI